MYREFRAIACAVAATVAVPCAPALAVTDPACLAVSDAAPPLACVARSARAAGAPAWPAGFVPGDLAYYMTITSAPPGEFLSAPLPTYTFAPIGSNPRPILAMDFDNSATTLYGIDNTTRELGTIDLATGAFTVVSTVQDIPAGSNVRGLRFDPTSANVYLLAGGELFTLDVATGATSLIATTSGIIIDIAISNSGQMYGHDILNDELVLIDKTDGSSTAIGPTGLNANFAQGLDFDLSDNTLYGFAFVTTPVQQGHLVRFDLATGAATILATAPAELEGAIKVAAVTTPVANALDAGGNGVLEPNETVVMAPTWRNNGTAAISLTGVLDNFTGPAGASYLVPGDTAEYGVIAPSASQGCGADCYSLLVSATARPVTHWDASARETVVPGPMSKTWALHIGDSFTDVPRSNGFYRFVEAILHKNVTGGCTATTYCPSSDTTRDQMAVFVLVARSAPGYVPPDCGTVPMFADVPFISGFCRWVEELARRGVVGGCGGGNYCPTAPATREQMAVFVLRTLDPALIPPACGTPMFADVPASSAFCPWIEELARRGIVTGCGGGNYCPSAAVTREQMGVFLAATFGLSLYGV